MHGPADDPHNLNNPWRWFVYDDPNLAYNTFRPQSGPRSFTDYYRGRGNQLYDEYQGRLGQLALTGQDPNLEYADFLQAYPFARRYQELSPQARGQDTRRFSPFTRFI